MTASMSKTVLGHDSIKCPEKYKVQKIRSSSSIGPFASRTKIKRDNKMAAEL